MKKWIPILLAVGVLMPTAVLAQHSSKAAEAKPSSKTLIIARKAVSIFGQISNDGKTLVSEENDIWVVTNPNVLAGHQGRLVSVKCRVNPEKNEIQVFSVKPALMEVKSASNKADSAFRR